jgi:hypothetical protein
MKKNERLNFFKLHKFTIIGFFIGLVSLLGTILSILLNLPTSILFFFVGISFPLILISFPIFVYLGGFLQDSILICSNEGGLFCQWLIIIFAPLFYGFLGYIIDRIKNEKN